MTTRADGGLSIVGMTRTHRIVTTAAIAGGTAWIAKFFVIAATDGAETGAADTATAVLYLSAVALLCVGAATVTLRFARGTASTIAAFVAAPLLAIASFLVVDAIVKPLVGDAGPSWLDDEAAIFVTGLVWLLVGLAARRPARTGAVGGAAPAGRMG